MYSRLWLLIFAVLLIPPVLLLIAIGLNRPPLFDSPGIKARLAVYLRENVAETTDNHPHPELQTPHYSINAEKLSDLVKLAMQELAWQSVEQDGFVLKAEVVSTLWRFVDDVEATVEKIDGGSRLHLRSSSRVGKVDFAANQRHIQNLIHKITELSADTSSTIKW